jgi:drug/metabolite transporter (DMT)-like permease
VLAASAAFSIAAALIKAAGEGVPPVEVALFRSVVMAAIVLPLMQRRGGMVALLRTRRPWGHVARTASGFYGMITSYYGYLHLPLAVNTALGFAMPLVLTMLSVPLLGERVGWRRAVAVLAGLAGVLVIVRPWSGVGEGLPLLPACIVLSGVVAWALAMISIRRLGASGESNEAIVAWFSIGGSLLAAILSAPFWVTPAWPQVAGLVGAGVISAIAQLFMTEGYRSGEATVVAPFEYGAIVYTTALGLAFWGERPDPWSIGGITVIVAAGLFVWRREAGGAPRAGPAVPPDPTSAPPP